MVYTPNTDMLFDGAQYGRLAAIQKAHALGTDMNSCDADGLTALHIAAIYQTDIVTRTLIALGANHSAVTTVKQTPLYYAARYDNSDALHALLDAGADIDAQDEIGNTALHVAVYMGNTAIVQELLLRGARKVLENKDGHTPEDFAISRGFHDITPFVGLTAEERSKRVTWTSPVTAPTTSTRPTRRRASAYWHKPAPDQAPTDPCPLRLAELRLLESIPIHVIGLVGQSQV